ncbi:MAG TPA: MobF family relaxase [Egibacteraceae bacterium]|nr:MobF family relaxase [Egibacteraceae bacterium]
MTTLKAGDAGPGALVDYYAGLAADQMRRDGRSRGPVDYYLDPNEPPGRWWGEGCAAMGVAGQVQPEQLARLLIARHPGVGRRLGRSFGAKSARGFDATFSTPKSASALWALTDDPWVRAEVLAGHDAAALAALEWFQRHGAVTRRGKDGVHQVDARGLVAALFRQHTSRSADPQLHTHAVISSKVQDPTGKWLALDSRFLKRQQRSISWVYSAALRSELTGRLGVSWGPTSDGHAEIDGVPAGILELFSQRTAQVEAKTAELIAGWIDEHDGAEPDGRTLYRLERAAVRASRPSKRGAVDAETLRAEWVRRARDAGFEALTLPDRQPHLPGATPVGIDEIVAKALETVSSSSSTWLRADLAREIAVLLPPEASATAADAVALCDRLADEAAGRCVELTWPRCSRRQAADGRPATEHVVDRRVTTPAVLAQERRLIDWARESVESVPEHSGQEAVRAITGQAMLVLLVGPAGAGKTRLLGEASAALIRSGRPALGLAPSGKAADVLAKCPRTPHAI